METFEGGSRGFLREGFGNIGTHTETERERDACICLARDAECV